MNGQKMKTLWIDDEPNDEFINEAYEFDIDITVCTCHEDGMFALKKPNSNWDAVILDANCKLTNDSQEAPSLESLTESILEIHTFCTAYYKFTPWFVYTGGAYEGFEQLESRISNKREWDDRKYYNKPIDRYKLYDNLKKAVEKSKEWKIKSEYNSAFEIFKIKSPFNVLGDIESSMLLKLLLAKDSIVEATYPDHLNNIRKFIAGGVMKTLSNMGVIPASIKELNKKGKHLSDDRFKINIPIHVQRSFHTIIAVCQDGSHSGKEAEEGKIPAQIDKLVREGDVPYLLISMVYDLLNILIWLKGFIKTNSDRDKNLIDFCIKETEKNESIDGWITGKVIRIAENGYGTFQSNTDKTTLSIIPAKVSELNLSTNQAVEVTTMQDNTGAKTFIENIRIT